MIQFLKKRNSVWVRILADTAVRGDHVKKGQLLEVGADDADALFGSERAEALPEPPTEEQVAKALEAANPKEKKKAKAD